MLMVQSSIAIFSAICLLWLLRRAFVRAILLLLAMGFYLAGKKSRRW